MKKQIQAWTVALLLSSYGLYGLWIAYSAQNWVPAAWGTLVLVGCVGLLLRKKWSQYVVYVFLLGVIVSWTIGVWKVAATGWPYSDFLSSVISLTPGILLVLFCAACGLVVFRHFR